MAGEGYSAWVQLDDVTVVVGPSTGTLYPEADGNIIDGRGATDAPLGRMTWSRSFNADKYPQEEADAFNKAWKAARNCVFGDYYWNNYGPYNVDLPWETGPPQPNIDATEIHNRSDNQANNEISWRFNAGTDIGGQGQLVCEVRGSGFSFKHSDLQDAAGPIGTCESTPTIDYDGYFAADADGRPWSVEYEAARCTILDVKVRPDSDSFSTEGGVYPMSATYYFQPIGGNVGWGNFDDPSWGYSFAAGGDIGNTPQTWVGDDSVTPFGNSQDVDHDPDWIAIDWEAALAAEVDHYRGYGFMVLPDAWLEPLAPVTGGTGGLDFSIDSYGKVPYVQFQLEVRPARFRAHYLATGPVDPEDPDPGDPEVPVGEMGHVRQTFQRGLGG